MDFIYIPATIEGLDPTSKASSTGLSAGRKAVKDTVSKN